MSCIIGRSIMAAASKQPVKSLLRKTSQAQSASRRNALTLEEAANIPGVTGEEKVEFNTKLIHRHSCVYASCLKKFG